MSNKQKLIILYVFIFVILCIFVGIALSLNHNSNSQIAGSSPTNSTPPSPLPSIKIISNSTPFDGQVGVEIANPITITLNPSVDMSKLSISINPQFNYNENVNANIINIAPTSPLIPGQKYTIGIQAFVNERSYLASISFTTVGLTITPNPAYDTDQVEKSTNQFDLINQPDIYLYNHCPYTGSDFSITSSIGSNGYPQFTVTTIGNNAPQAKNDFIVWAESLGLTANQIQSLNITYQ